MRGFRDAHEAILNLNSFVIGISRDSTESHRRFKKENDLTFPLVTDEGGRIAALYDLRWLWGLAFGATKRGTYIVDKTGFIQGSYHHEFAINRHIFDVLKGLERLSYDG